MKHTITLEIELAEIPANERMELAEQTGQDESDMPLARDIDAHDALEIAVTPEMAHAGAMMLLSWDDMPLYPPGEYLLKKAAELYREMTTAKKASQLTSL